MLNRTNNYRERERMWLLLTDWATPSLSNFNSRLRDVWNRSSKWLALVFQILKVITIFFIEMTKWFWRYHFIALPQQSPIFLACGIVSQLSKIYFLESFVCRNFWEIMRIHPAYDNDKEMAKMLFLSSLLLF